MSRDTSFATDMLNNGVSICGPSFRNLGHKSLTTTQRYTHLPTATYNSITQLAHPRARTTLTRMEVNVKAIHFEATGKLIEFINKKADRLARRFPGAITGSDVTLKVIKPETANNKDVLVLLSPPTAANWWLPKPPPTPSRKHYTTRLSRLSSHNEKFKEKK